MNKVEETRQATMRVILERLSREELVLIILNLTTPKEKRGNHEETTPNHS